MRRSSSGRRELSTAERILDEAERLIQTRGFNGFSYADIAAALGIQKASLHHHFATKAQLGLAVVDRYRSEFLGALALIERETPDAAVRLERYVGLYGGVLRRRRMCLCGMLAADVATLEKPIRDSLAGYFGENESWLERVLDLGRQAGEVRFEGSPASMAAFVVGSLEGAMLVARGSGQIQEFERAAERLLALLVAPRPAAAHAASADVGCAP